MDYSEIIDCLLLQVPTAGFSDSCLCDSIPHSCWKSELRSAAQGQCLALRAGSVSISWTYIYRSPGDRPSLPSLRVGAQGRVIHMYPPPPLRPHSPPPTPHTLSLVPYETCQNKPAHANQQERKQSAVGPGYNLKQISRWSQPLNWKTSLCSQRRFWVGKAAPWHRVANEKRCATAVSVHVHVPGTVRGLVDTPRDRLRLTVTSDSATTGRFSLISATMNAAYFLVLCIGELTASFRPCFSVLPSRKLSWNSMAGWMSAAPNTRPRRSHTIFAKLRQCP